MAAPPALWYTSHGEQPRTTMYDPEIQELYDELPVHEQIAWDAGEDLAKLEDDERYPYGLPEPLMTFWAVFHGGGVIQNGGFQYFFENDWPDNPNYSIFIDAYERIGATGAAAAMRAAVADFPFPDPHLDFEARREHLYDSAEQAERDGTARSDRCGDASFIEQRSHDFLDQQDEIYRSLAAYLLQHREHFPFVTSQEAARSSG